MRFTGEGPLTLKEFVRWLASDDPRCVGIRPIWVFEGAYLAGHTIQGGDFPLEQTLPEWNAAFDAWEKIMEGYR